MYAKIFAQIYDGTLCTQGPWQALVTFQQLLVLADQHGVVDMTPSAIARRTTIPLEIIDQGISALLLPDPESRTPTEGGRRIVPLSADRAWGWRVVNYEHYRQIKREEDRREYHAKYWRENRSPRAKAAGSTDQQSLNITQQAQPNQPIAYAEANAILEVSNDTSSPAKLPTCPTQQIVDQYHQHLPELPTVRLLETSRKKAICSFWKWALTSKRSDGRRRASCSQDAIEWIGSYFERARANDFIMGRTARSPDHQNWSADLDYLISAKGRKQVIEKTREAA
jgi:hypothetical protein